MQRILRCDFRTRICARRSFQFLFFFFAGEDDSLGWRRSSPNSEWGGLPSEKPRRANRRLGISKESVFPSYWEKRALKSSVCIRGSTVGSCGGMNLARGLHVEEEDGKIIPRRLDRVERRARISMTEEWEGRTQWCGGEGGGQGEKEILYLGDPTNGNRLACDTV